MEHGVKSAFHIVDVLGIRTVPVSISRVRISAVSWISGKTSVSDEVSAAASWGTAESVGSG